MVTQLPGNWLHTIANADWISDPVFRPHGRDFSMQLYIDNTDAVGVIYLQCNNDGERWHNVSFVNEAGSVQNSIVVSTGVDTDEILVVRDLPVGQFRMFWDNTSGNGALSTITTRGRR